MSERRRAPREKDLTSRFKSGDLEMDRVETQQRFTPRSKAAEQNKIEKTTLLRAAEAEQVADIDSLPIGQVIQVYSLFSDVQHETGVRLCVMRKTLSKVSDTSIVVGDYVRFRDTGVTDDSGRPEAVIEQVLSRKSILTRTNSFNTRQQHPIVANAQQMLIVASLLRPVVKWGLVDRMIVAAQSGKLDPIVCLNKIDLADSTDRGQKELSQAREVLAHYQSLGITTLQTSAAEKVSVDHLAQLLHGRTTVLAGHSGVGKSSLIAAVQPGLDIRIGEISNYTDKGRHTTTSARRYLLNAGGEVIDTPGVKLFGLWGVTADNLGDYFPDVQNDTAPAWRVESYRRIAESF